MSRQCSTTRAVSPRHQLPIEPAAWGFLMVPSHNGLPTQRDRSCVKASDPFPSAALLGRFVRRTGASGVAKLCTTSPPLHGSKHPSHPSDPVVRTKQQAAVNDGHVAVAAHGQFLHQKSLIAAFKAACRTRAAGHHAIAGKAAPPFPDTAIPNPRDLWPASSNSSTTPHSTHGVQGQRCKSCATKAYQHGPGDVQRRRKASRVIG